MAFNRRPHSSPDLPPPFGVTTGPNGPMFAIHANDADAVWVCIDRGDGREERVELLDHTHGVWFGDVPALTPGTRYGIRTAGPYNPRGGRCHNPAKLLVDPYAHAIDGDLTWRPEVLGHRADANFEGDLAVRDDRDSAPYVPRSVVIDHNAFDWGDDERPHVPWTQTVIYEAHVRGMTMRHPDVPEHLRGTYAGMAHPAVIDHLVTLGITSIELLPIHSFTSERFLDAQGLSNYWGYNTLGYFAPEARYAAASDPQGVVDEVKGMVKAFHAAGIEVILDVVYNHTCEERLGSGPTLSLRGLDQGGYYRTTPEGLDADVTGCGNTVDTRWPQGARFVLDSLRHWITQYRIDGFRFDLAAALARGHSGSFEADHPFFVAVRSSPTLSQAKLIAEPWDIGMGGWCTGQFPPPFAEWNDRYRDTVRQFWLSDRASSRVGVPGQGIGDIARRLTGSADLFDHADRGPIASINYVTAHDGFTMADLTAYDGKHNEANGEDNRDGTDNNRSWNHGVEGPTDDAVTRASRHRTARSLMGTLLLSSGIPMITAGDEMLRTQHGNNNAYCQDNDLSWVDWDLDGDAAAMLDSTRALLALRRDHPDLVPRHFFPGTPVEGARMPSLTWFDTYGNPVTTEVWESGWTRTLQMLLLPPSTSQNPADLEKPGLLLVLHGGDQDVDVTLPDAPGVRAYARRWDSADTGFSHDDGSIAPGRTLLASAGSLIALDALR